MYYYNQTSYHEEGQGEGELEEGDRLPPHSQLLKSQAGTDNSYKHTNPTNRQILRDRRNRQKPTKQTCSSDFGATVSWNCILGGWR